MSICLSPFFCAATFEDLVKDAERPVFASLAFIGESMKNKDVIGS